MKRPELVLAVLLLSFSAAESRAGDWAKPKSPVIPEASGYVPIPNAVVKPEAGRIYRAIYDATRGADKPDQLVPALDMAGSELNLFGSVGFPLKKVKFAVVFHGAAMDGILDDAHYREKYKVSNPNLAALARMKKAGGGVLRVRAEPGRAGHHAQGGGSGG